MKMLAIIRREYLERVRTKGFVISTLLIPLLMALIMVVPMLTMQSVDTRNTIGLIDPSGEYFSRLDESLSSQEDLHVSLIPLPVTGGDVAAATAGMQDQIRDESLDGGVVIGDDFVGTPKATYYSRSVSGSIVRDDLQPALDRVLRQARFARAGVPDSLHAFLSERVAWESLSVGDTGEATRRDEGGVMLLAFTLIMMLYMMVLVYGQQTLTAVIEEKSSRVVEVLLSSVPSSQLMFGKVVGIGAAGLTQVAIWTAAIFVMAGQGLSVGGISFDASYLTPMILGSFMVFFLLGFLLFSMMYAGVGALCNSIQEAQPFATPIMMFVIIPMMLMTLVLRAPGSPLATVLSLIPMFSPILMFMRVCLASPPLWQVLLSWVLMSATIWMMSRAAGKLFRVGILMSGSAPNWATLIRTLRQPD
ncbi:MAG: ABC transporter permease [bacterium]|nr:ABC transporter permease [bacterium]